MTADGGERGRGRGAARRRAALRDEQPYTHSVPFSERSGERIEPLISLQWFCRMDELAAPAIEVVERDEVRIVPENYKRVYLDWMREIRPWCISRQLWWGHQIPVWYGPGRRGGRRRVGGARPRGGAPSAGIDPDSLTPGDRRPRHLVQLGAVAVRDPRLARRHAASAGLLSDQLPDHGARDHLPLGRADGDDGDRVRRRRSRSATSTCTRSSRRPTAGGCRSRSAPGSTRSTRSRSTAPTRCASACWRCPRPRTSATRADRVQQGRDLANKMWNASRLILLNAGDAEPGAADRARSRTAGSSPGCDAAIAVGRRRASRTTTSPTRCSASTRSSGRSSATGTWRSSSRGSTTATRTRRRTCSTCSSRCCALAHPVMPFVTEEIWSYLPDREELLIVSRVPDAGPVAGRRRGRGGGRAGDRARPRRCAAGATWSACRPAAVLEARIDGRAPEFVARLARLRALGDRRRRAAGDDRPDRDPRLRRGRRRAGRASGSRPSASGCGARSSALERKLGNEGFVAKAPPEVVEAEREKLDDYRAELDRAGIDP